MFRLLFLTVVTICLADKFVYTAEPLDHILTVLDDNPFLQLWNIDNDSYPSNIEYLQNIEPTTGLMVRLIFGNENGPLDSENGNDTAIDICDILDNKLDDPENSEILYNIVSYLGLEGERCPIEKGNKSLAPYMFPTEYTTKDLGCGKRYFEIRLEQPDHDPDSEAIMKLRVNVTLTRNNETCVENLSSTMPLPTITATTILALYIIIFNN